MTLRLHCRALVNEKVAEVDIGIAEIVAEDALTEMLEEQLAGRRLAIKLTTLVARTIKGDVGLAIIGHEAAEEGWQQPFAIFHQTSHHLLGIEGWRLVSEIDIAIDLAGLPQNGHVGKAVSVSQGPEGRIETDGTNGPCQGPRRLEIVAVDHGNIGTDGSVLGHIAVEAAADLNLDILGSDVIEKLSGQRIFVIDNRNHLEQLVKGDRDCR